MYYGAARSEGYNFYYSTAFTFAGSYEWKIFGENIAPEKNSLIATTLGGEILGEILYRISSNILDDLMNYYKSYDSKFNIQYLRIQTAENDCFSLTFSSEIKLQKINYSSYTWIDKIIFDEPKALPSQLPILNNS